MPIRRSAGLRPARRPEPKSDLTRAVEAALMHLACAVGALYGSTPLAHPSAQQGVMAWTRVDGLAELVLYGDIPLRTDDLNRPETRAEREALFRGLFEVHLVPR